MNVNWILLQRWNQRRKPLHKHLWPEGGPAQTSLTNNFVVDELDGVGNDGAAIGLGEALFEVRHLRVLGVGWVVDQWMGSEATLTRATRTCKRSGRNRVEL